MLFLNPYDADRLSEGKTLLQSSLELLKPSYLAEILFYLFYLRKVFTIAFCVLVIYLILNKRYREMTVIFIITFIMTVLFNTMVTENDFKVWTLTHSKYDQWSLHIRFVIFTALCFWMIEEIKSWQFYRAMLVSIVVFFLLSSLQLFEYQEQIGTYVQQTNKIIARCRQAGVRKAVISLNDLDPAVPLHHNVFMDIMVMSSLQSPDSCIQVVYVDDEFNPHLTGAYPDQILLSRKGPFLHHDGLNKKYYRLPEAAYADVSMQ